MNELQRQEERKNRSIIRNVATLNSRDALKKLTLSVNVRRLTTDSNGTILDDATVPIDQRKAYPFHLFGEFDRQGGYNIADSIVSGKENTILFGVYVWGLNSPLFFFSILATINNQFKKGDLIFIYVDNINAPNYFHFVIVTTDTGGYASLVSQSNITQLDDSGYWGVFKFFDIKYSWIHDSQVDYPLIKIKTRYNGASTSDSINPEAYLYTQQQPDIHVILIELEAVLNQYFGLTSFISWQNPILGLTFNIYV